MAAKKPRRTKAKPKPLARRRPRVGRPSVYKPEFAEQSKKLAELGARDVDLADFFGVAIATVSTWKTKHPEFLEALKVGKGAVDDRVERSLLQRALGYTFDSEKIFLPKDSRTPVRIKTREHCPPDVVACIFWLKNRRRDDWRDRQELEHTGKDGGPIEVKDDMSDLEKARRVAFLLSLAGSA